MVYNAFASPCFKDNPCRQPKLRIDHSNSNFLCQDAPQRLKSRAVPTWIPGHLGCVHVWALDSSPLPLVPCVLLEKKQGHMNITTSLFLLFLSVQKSVHGVHSSLGCSRQGALNRVRKAGSKHFPYFPGMAAFFCTWKGNFWYQAG